MRWDCTPRDTRAHMRLFDEAANKELLCNAKSRLQDATVCCSVCCNCK